MATTNLDATNLSDVPIGGQIHEELMDKIYDISPVDRPFCDAIGSETAGNALKNWIREDLAAANPNNARIDGASSVGINNTRTGERLSNRSEEHTSELQSH